MTYQLAFTLPVIETFARKDFFVSNTNITALSAVDAWQNWPAGKMLLIGPPGSGKTHLAHIWLQATGATLVKGKALATVDIAALSEQGCVCVEDAEDVAGDAEREAAFFHLHNIVTQGAFLLVTAATPPRDWGLRLPDLASRLQAASLTQIDVPDDALLSAVLVKLFADRQITVQPNLISYLVQRMERSLATARLLVATLDTVSLAHGRPVTRQLAASVLGIED